MRIALKIAAMLTVLLALPPEWARAENGVTVYGGYRFGGGVTDSTTNSSIDLADGSSAAMAVDIGLDANRQIEIFFSRQHTALTSGAFSPQANNVGLTFYNYQIGGTNYIDELGRGVYVMGGIGGTTVKPDQSGLNSQSFFSGNLGIGWMAPLAKNLGLRFEARGYAILINNNGAIFCGGTRGCTVAINGSAVFEGELLAGVAWRF